MWLVGLAVVGFLFMMWRSGAFQGMGQALGQTPGGGTNINISGQPGSPLAPAVSPGGTTTPTLPPLQGCNCTTNVSCNAFCSNIASFNQCCFGSGTTTTPPPAVVEPPDPNPSLCSSHFNGSCNVECSEGTEEECIECNGICEENVPYTGDEPIEEPPATAGAAQPTCPPGYTYSVTYNLCVQATAAPVYPSTPIPPPLTTANQQRCSSVYNGSCNSECSGGSQAECNDCMLTCGLATGGTSSSGGTSGGRTAECSSRYNGSCNTECSSGNNSTCNACRAACGLSANIATVRSASQARHLLNNRLYNSLRANSYNPRYRRTGYDRHSRAAGNIIKVGNLL